MWRRAWIETRHGRAGTPSYVVRWLGDDGRKRQEGAGPVRKIAEGIRREREQQLNAGLLRRTDDPRLAALAEEHLVMIANQVRPATVREHREVLQRLQAFCGNLRVSRLTPRLAERYFAMRLASVRPATANKDLRTLRAILRRAMRRGALASDPFAGVRPVREPEPAVRVLSADEVARLLAACDPESVVARGARSQARQVRLHQWRAFLYLALTTGLRSGELTHLRWEDIDRERGVLTVRSSAEHRTKGGRGRTVPLLPEAADLLAVLPRGDWVFVLPSGRRWRNNLQREFQALASAAGVQCTLHDLRRTYASHLQMGGAPAAVAQRLLGHASALTTARHYTGVLDAALVRAAERLPYRTAWKGAADVPQGLVVPFSAKTA